jgi:uncharacterized protein
MEPAATPPAPLDPGERLHALDILRGLALFGMILVHFHQTMRLEVTGVEDLIGWGIWILVEQKAWGTFAFLFGVGFAVLLRRLEARHAPVVAIYLRRMAGLACFGLIAQVFLGFHILLEYAMWGVALLVLRRWPTWLLLLTAAVAACARPLLFVLMTAGWWDAAAFAGARALRQAVRAAAAQPDYGPLLSARWALFLGTHTWRNLVPDTNLALFIVGLLAIRRRVLDEPARHIRAIGGWMAFGAAAWAASWLLLPRLPEPGPAIDSASVLFAIMAGLLQDQWLCFTYIGAVVLLLVRRPIWTQRLALFGLAGRMALTNYMLQIVVLDVLASSYGVGLKLRPALYVVATVLLFAAEAGLSRFWLGRFRWGPLEWLWRTLTYARPQPIRREVAPALAIDAGLRQ